MTKRPCQPRLKFNSSNFFKFTIKNKWGAQDTHPIQRGNHVNVSIKTFITSLVAKRSSQLTHTMVFLNLSKSTKVSSMNRPVDYFKFPIGPQGVSLQLIYLKQSDKD